MGDEGRPVLLQDRPLTPEHLAAVLQVVLAGGQAVAVPLHCGGGAHGKGERRGGSACIGWVANFGAPTFHVCSNFGSNFR